MKLRSLKRREKKRKGYPTRGSRELFQPIRRCPVFRDLDCLRSKVASLFFSAYVLIFLLALFTSLCLAAALLCASVFFVVARLPAALFCMIPFTRDPTLSEIDPEDRPAAAALAPDLAMRFIALSPRRDRGCSTRATAPGPAAMSSRRTAAISISTCLCIMGAKTTVHWLFPRNIASNNTYCNGASNQHYLLIQQAVLEDTQALKSWGRAR